MAHYRDLCWPGDNLQTAVTVAKECAMIDTKQKVLQVEAVLVEASPFAAKHLRVVYKDLSLSPESIDKTMSSPSAHNGDYCFAVDGSTYKSLKMYDIFLMERIIHRTKVFARMAPEDKQDLIENLQKIGYQIINLSSYTNNLLLNKMGSRRQVAMVGDGCNDCGALRTADAGISLSTADASVAAPFTSQGELVSIIHVCTETI